MEILTNSERETEAAGAAFSAKLPDGTVVAMYGELGAGKDRLRARHGPGHGPGLRVNSRPSP